MANACLFVVSGSLSPLHYATNEHNYLEGIPVTLDWTYSWVANMRGGRATRSVVPGDKGNEQAEACVGNAVAGNCWYI